MDPYSLPRKDNGVDTKPEAFSGLIIILPGDTPVAISIPGLLTSIVMLDDILPGLDNIITGRSNGGWMIP